jgi:hypothetical protein
MAIANRHVETVFASASRGAATYNSSDYSPAADIRGARVYLDVTVDGGGTVDLTVQGKTPAGGYYAIGGATTTQLGAVGNEELLIYPGVAETGNETVNDILPGEFRIEVVVGVAAMTFSVVMEYLP